MTEIQKSITRDIKDRKKSLLLFVPDFIVLSFVAFLIILGLEIYFFNTSSNEDPIYLAGPFSLIFGILLFFAISKKRRSLKNYRNWVTQKGKQVTENLTINAQHFSHETVGYMKCQLSWNSLSKYKEHKKHIEIVLAGSTFQLPTSLFNSEERAFLLELIKTKSNFTSTPPPIPAETA